MKIELCDTTLRDGEQMPGVVFSSSEKLELAIKSVDFGSSIIEIMPVVSESEQMLARQLMGLGLKCKITASTPSRKKDIETALKCDLKHITLFASLSDIHLKHKLGISREENIALALELLDFAQARGLKVAFAGEDATRADFDYVIEFVKALGKIDYFLPCDTLGCLTPFQTKSFIEKLKKKVKCRLGLHCHNDFGLAVANTLAGLKAGAEIFSGTFNGLGERSGNAAIEEVCVALKFLENAKANFKLEKLTELCWLVESYSEVKVQAHKPIIGKNAFCHESGIHVDGVVKHARNYEAFKPETVGQTRNFSFGKHSGKSILRQLFGPGVSENELKELLQEVKRLAQCNKKSLSQREVLHLYSAYKKNKG